MLTLKDILDNLTYGDLSHVSIGGAPLGFVDPKDYPKIISCLNGALTALHKRFLLRTAEIKVQEHVGINTYYLRHPYAATNTGDILATKYLLDTSDTPFTGDDVLKIEKVISDQTGAFVLNDSTQACPVFTPNFDTFTITPANPPEILRVQYRANHPRIKVDAGFDPNLIEMNIPTAILDAISLNVAARIYTPLTSGDGQNSAASAYMYRYELECKRIEEEGMVLDGDLADTRFEDCGWV